MSFQVNLGRIRLNFCGVWDSTVAYSTNDVVSYLSGCYVCTSTTGSIVGTLPTTTTTWTLLVAAPTEPRGVVKMWYGNSGDVPEGWAICDGTNGTPDLRGKFIMGADANYATGTVGGNTAVTPTITVQGTVLSVDQIPAHVHWYETQYKLGGGAGDAGTSGEGMCGANKPTVGPSRFNAIPPQPTAETGNGQPHAHGATSSAVPTIPPFTALHYIMKL